MSCELLTTISDRYGHMKTEDVAANHNLLATPFDPNKPIEVVWARTKDVMHFADIGGKPIPEPMVVDALKKVFSASGVLDTAITTWNTHLPNPITLELFKTHMTLYDDERRSALPPVPSTTQLGGYQGANAALLALPPPADMANAATTAPAPRTGDPPGLHTVILMD
jgi:hypothetical protein